MLGAGFLLARVLFALHTRGEQKKDFTKGSRVSARMGSALPNVRSSPVSYCLSHMWKTSSRLLTWLKSLFFTFFLIDLFLDLLSSGYFPTASHLFRIYPCDCVSYAGLLKHWTQSSCGWTEIQQNKKQRNNLQVDVLALSTVTKSQLLLLGSIQERLIRGFFRFLPNSQTIAHDWLLKSNIVYAAAKPCVSLCAEIEV